MTNGSNSETFQHTAIEREPELSGERRRGKPPPRPPRIVSRTGHANSMAETVRGTLEQAETNRAAHGVAPDRLLVLEFRSWDAAVRDVIESRLGATVVDEQVESRALSRRLVQLPAGVSPDELASSLAGHDVEAGACWCSLRHRGRECAALAKASRDARANRHAVRRPATNRTVRERSNARLGRLGERGGRMRRTKYVLGMLEEDCEICEPCLWCGPTDNEAAFEWTIDGQHGWAVTCSSCGATGPMAYHTTENKAHALAIDEWNR